MQINWKQLLLKDSSLKDFFPCEWVAAQNVPLASEKSPFATQHSVCTKVAQSK